jgi:hypothetical protein
MHVVRDEPGVTVIRCFGDLSLPEIARVAAAAAWARAAGRLAVVELTRVRHLHYAGARLLADVPA